jgi:transcriptional regulator with XRE-family HTH domain
MSESTLGERIKIKRKALGLSQKALAKMSGLEQPTISALELNQAASTRNVASIAHALQVNALWLEKGDGDADDILKGKVTQPSVEVMEAEGRTSEYRIEVMESRGSCGGGDPVKQRDVDDILSTMPPLYKDQAFFAAAGVEPTDVKALVADGDGMANFIVHGDTVLVTTAHRDRLLPGVIYAISTPTGYQLRRFLRRSDGRLILSFDNPDKHRYPDEEYSAEQAANIEIFGRFLRREG